MIRGVGVDAVRFRDGRFVEDEELKELAIDPTLMVDRSIVSFAILDPVVLSSAVDDDDEEDDDIDEAFLESCAESCCSGTGGSDSALRQNDTVKGVISVMHSSKRKLLLSVAWFVALRLVDLKDGQKTLMSFR